MNKIQAKRLLNVAKALRESNTPEAFNMDRYVYGRLCGFDCGTPACALGHYAAREDLQQLLRIKNKNGDYPNMVFVEGNHSAYFDNAHVLGHFGLTYLEGAELFDGDGCGNAKDPRAAAAYIENFVQTKLAEQHK